MSAPATPQVVKRVPLTGVNGTPFQAALTAVNARPDALAHPTEVAR